MEGGSSSNEMCFSFGFDEEGGKVLWLVARHLMPLESFGMHDGRESFIFDPKHRDLFNVPMALYISLQYFCNVSGTCTKS